MSLRRHEGEGLIVGVKNHHASRERNAAWDRHVNEGYFARGNPGEGRKETVPFGPKRREVVLPGSDDLGWLRRGPLQADSVGFLPHLAEALQRTEGLAAFHIEIQCTSWYPGYLHCCGLLRPGGSISWLSLPEGVDGIVIAASSLNTQTML